MLPPCLITHGLVLVVLLVLVVVHLLDGGAGEPSAAATDPRPATRRAQQRVRAGMSGHSPRAPCGVTCGGEW
ncbi:hypothetical protein [Streptomyces sp. NPDC086010]|uniref:hypothetical protein n=1 Tax=Streptomyces sp. NPDC086010 TaxID=3365745 RepID=UPI0037D4A1D2